MESRQLQAGNEHFVPGNLRFLRRKHQLSQEELAAQLGLKRGNIASYENGSAEPKVCYLIRIAEFFRIPLLDFTKRNLAELEDGAQEGLSRLEGLCPIEKSKLEDMRHEIADFQHFLDGIMACYQYKSKNLQAQEGLPQEANFIFSHFEQLHAASQRMAQLHAELLNMCFVPGTAPTTATDHEN